MAGMDSANRRRRPSAGLRLGALAGLALLALGCSLQRLAARAVGGALAGGGSVWASDDDPELVGQAMPFALKTVESLLAAAPGDRRLLLSACSGFTQYAYAYLASEADYREATDFAGARQLRERARRLYARARRYGLDGLEAARPGLGAAVRGHDEAALAAGLARARPAEVPLLYWTALAWGAEISLAKDDPELSGDLPKVERLMRRALALEPGFGDGALWDFFITYEGSRPAAAGGSIERARAAFAEATRLSGGRRAGPFLALAESVAVATQDRAEFSRLVEQALAVDAAASGEQRLANLLAQRRARWLLARLDDLFLE